MTVSAALADGQADVPVRCVVNGVERELRVAPGELLLDMLRERLGLTGAKRSCDVEICGSCTVLLDGRAVSACTTLALDAEGSQIRTVEGLASDGRLSHMQRAFVRHSAMQCGYCTPGFLMMATALAEELPGAGTEEVKAYLNGNVCRCGSYNTIVAAVQDALGTRQGVDK